MSNFWNINANVQIAAALFLIVVLLTYIAFQLSKEKKPSKSSKTYSR